MAVDPYSLCPCGSGKKLKFCCSDLVGEIDKIHRMIEGEQPRAALRHVEQTLASHPSRASLLDLKASLELTLGEHEAARETIERFVREHGESPVAHACHAMLLSESHDARGAAAALQRALALVEREMPRRVFEAMGHVGEALLEEGHVVAAQAHFWLHAALAPKEDTRAHEVLAALHHYAGMPLLLRDRLDLRAWPEDAPWKAEAEQASRLAGGGKWQAAVEIVDGLGQRYGADPTLVYNRALLGGWLGDDRALVAGLHAYAQLGVPLDDAVEAEAIAQLLDPDLKEERLESVVQSYAIGDLEDLVSRLHSDRRAAALPVDAPGFGESGQPPPRHVFVLFDRPMPESGANLAREDVPRMGGVLAIYGRQTDRPERLELTAEKGPRFDATINTLREAGGEALGEMLDERVIGTVSPTEQALNWRWQLPPDTSREDRQRLMAEEAREAIVERWSSLPRPALGGKAPREAAGDPALRIPLMAAVLILEQGSNTERHLEAIDELRRELGLPQPEPIEPGEDAARLSLGRVPRLDVEALSDDDLVQLYRRAAFTGAQRAIARLAREALRRPSLEERIPPSEAYLRLIAVERDPDRALALIGEARQHSRSLGQSTAAWDLSELELHIDAHNVGEVQAVLDRIEREHRGDPDVSAALYRILYERGLLPEELPRQAASYEEPAAVGSVPEPASRIWTPDSERPSGGKSALWTPG